MAISRLAGRRAEASILINASRLVTAYYAEQSDVLYIKALAAPFTVNTMPEGTLKALTNHKELDSIMPADGGDCEEVLAQFAKAGIDIDDLAAKLQSEGATLFDNFWNELMTVIAWCSRRPVRRAVMAVRASKLNGDFTRSIPNAIWRRTGYCWR